MIPYSSLHKLVPAAMNMNILLPTTCPLFKSELMPTVACNKVPDSCYTTYTVDNMITSMGYFHVLTHITHDHKIS